MARLMRRVAWPRLGGPDALGILEEPMPEPGVGEVLIAVEAAGVSFVDDLIAQGRYQVRPPLPFTPGQ